ncbi:MAG: hypothetical protein J6S23_01710 [Clostridia bacterium]|nr:hypothetical protein [Clostridia bacterium]
MEVVCFALGMIIGGALTGVAAFIICKGYKAKAEVLESEEKRAERRMRQQWANFAAYDGTSKGQEEID